MGAVTPSYTGEGPGNKGQSKDTAERYQDTRCISKVGFAWGPRDRRLRLVSRTVRLAGCFRDLVPRPLTTNVLDDVGAHEERAMVQRDPRGSGLMSRKCKAPG